MPKKSSAKPKDEDFRGDIQQKKGVTMSMIDPSEWNLEDSQEPYALKDGSEVRLQVLDVSRSTRENGGVYYTTRFGVVDEPYSKDITDWFDEPSRSLMDAKQLNAAKRKMMNFLDCFSIDRTRPTDPTEDWVGAEGWTILSLSTSARYGEQNRISKFIAPR